MCGVDKWLLMGLTPRNAGRFRAIEDAWRDNGHYALFLTVHDRIAGGETVNDLLDEYEGTNGPSIRKLERQHAGNTGQGGIL